MGANDNVVRKVLDEAVHPVRSDCALAGILVPHRLRCVYKYRQTPLPGQIHERLKLRYFSQVKPLGVRVQLADSRQSGRNATLNLFQGAVSPGRVDRAEPGQPFRIFGCRLDYIIIGFPGYFRIAPPETHDHGTVNFGTIHCLDQVLNLRYPRTGLGKEAGKRNVPCD